MKKYVFISVGLFCWRFNESFIQWLIDSVLKKALANVGGRLIEVKYERKTFGTWQKPGGNRDWRLIEGWLIEGIL